MLAMRTHGASCSQEIVMAIVHITLPDQLAQEAQQAGLLSSARLEKLLREQIKTQRIDELFTAMDRMAIVNEPPAMSPEEVAAEIAAMRAERRQYIHTGC